jgi:hypothetical protein
MSDSKIIISELEKFVNQHGLDSWSQTPDYELARKIFNFIREIALKNYTIKIV